MFSSLMSSKFLLVGTGLLALAGCMTSTPDRPDPVPAPEQYKNATPSSALLEGSNWWNAFQEPRLDQILADVEARNPGLDAALERLQSAEAALGVRQSAQYPGAALQPMYQRGRQVQFIGGSSGAIYALPAVVNYEVDLFGGIRHRIASAEADAEAAAADYAVLKLMLQTQAAQTWFNLRAADEELRLLRETVSLRKDAWTLMDTRFRGGDTSELDVERARAEWSEAREQAAAVEQARRQLEHALATLTGRMPSTFHEEEGEPLIAPPAIPTGVPSELLQRRPDLAGAMARVESARRLVGAARANFYPKLLLSGRAGLTSLSAESFLDATSLTWGLGPSIDLPLFQGKRLKSLEKQSLAQFRMAWADYRGTLLSAFREVEDGLAATEWLTEREKHASEAAEASQKAAALSRERYEAGLVSYLEVIDAERTRVNNLRNLTRVRQERLLAAVQLIKALGGGWQAALPE